MSFQRNALTANISDGVSCFVRWQPGLVQKLMQQTWGHTSHSSMLIRLLHNGPTPAAISICHTAHHRLCGFILCGYQAPDRGRVLIPEAQIHLGSFAIIGALSIIYVQE